VTGSATWTTSDANIAVVSTSGGAGRGGPGAVCGRQHGNRARGWQREYQRQLHGEWGHESRISPADRQHREYHRIPHHPDPPDHPHGDQQHPAVPGQRLSTQDNTAATVTASTDWTSSPARWRSYSDSGATTGRATGLTAGTTDHHRHVPREHGFPPTLTVSAATPTGLACDAHQSHHASRYQPALRGRGYLGEQTTPRL